jgi:RNA polymerase sigma-70 factor (ECF subfamily)
MQLGGLSLLWLILYILQITQSLDAFAEDEVNKKMSDNNDISLTPSGTSRFATTHWSVILAAGDSSSPQHREALETLCRTYWYPLYAFLRRRGHDRHQAEDYIQGFFASLLEKQGLRLANSDKGKFRSYLLGALKHFLANERDRARTQKRGGDYRVFSLDFDSGEDQYAPEPAHQLSPDKLFERSWALTVLHRAASKLEAEWSAMHKQELFQHLVIYLAPAEETVSYRDMAAKLNMSEAAVKTATYRIRKRYRELLRGEVAQTVATEEQIEEGGTIGP